VSGRVTIKCLGTFIVVTGRLLLAIVTKFKDLLSDSSSFGKLLPLILLELRQFLTFDLYSLEFLKYLA